MKKIIGIIIIFNIILTGCSSAKEGADNTVEKIQSQSQLQSENTTKSIEGSNSNTNSNSLENIDTTKSQFKSGYYDYEGTINNNIRIQMSIYPLKKDIVGTYFYEKQRKEIKLIGKAGEKNIILNEYDETGKNTGTFKGTMNTIDKIEGTWISADSKSSFPFTLLLKSNIPGALYGKRYAVAMSSKSDKDVENFVSQIQSFVVKDNREQLAEKVKYPINVKIDNKIIKIQNKNGFILNYTKIFNPNYKKEISNAFTKYLFVNWQGVMFGEGLYNMWINEVTPSGSDSKLMITSINN